MTHVAFRSPLLLQLPVELLDLIASFVTTHRDIVSLALTCHALSRIVIPAHAAYRTIRIHSQRGPVPWATIAARPDRAAGIRCLVLFDQSEEGRFLPERAPTAALASATSCMKPRRAGPRGRGWNAETLEAAASAVRAMPNLHTLVFSGSLRRCRAPECRATETKFWEAVAGTCGTLRRLEYAQPPREVSALPSRSMAEMKLYPVRLLTGLHCADADPHAGYLQLWSVSNLTSLSVKHAAFLRHPPSVVQFSRVLHNSPSLEVMLSSLAIP